MSTAETTVHRMEDYRPPPYTVGSARLRFDIHDTHVTVAARLEMEAGTDTPDGEPLVLNGEQLTLRSVAVDGRPLAGGEYAVSDHHLRIPAVPRAFVLETVVDIDPYHNTWLEGLYRSGNILCTQNESEGFRRITYYPDRPDVMGVFTTTITADRRRFPLLLSNGNPVERRELDGGRHLVTWEDPFPKPCYLFALVAGDLAVVRDRYTTLSGRSVALEACVDKGNEDRVAHALDSLKRAMRWDEETFGLEYDLDLFMLVAVDAFNYGAMENKGLNIFNSACALANPDTATDNDFLRVESVVAHEYFHNWTGDRVTLRDWFQITLKEGLTVYRDAEFTADTHSRAIKCIQDARHLRDHQFSEDEGPNAHPIQPRTYREVSNFYTSTVYSKGAAVIRMIRTMTGRAGFRKGMDLYFARHDGKAVTTEDFVSAMEDANDLDLGQFRRWYSQAGTPVCRVTGQYDPDALTYTLRVRQTTPPTADGSAKEPFHIPMTLGLLAPDGRPFPLRLDGEDATDTTERTLHLKAAEEAFVFTGIPEPPVPSLFRSFSAPVRVRHDATTEDLVLLLRHDEDLFNRYDAAQRLALSVILNRPAVGGEPAHAPAHHFILDAFGAVLADEAIDPSFRALALSAPTLATIVQEMDPYDFDAGFEAREVFIAAFAARHADTLRRIYAEYRAFPYRRDAVSIARRRLCNQCLAWLARADGTVAEVAHGQFREADNMTDRLEALAVLCRLDHPLRAEVLAAFYETWKDDFNVINKWFALQAGAPLTRAYDDVLRLARDPVFDGGNPNRLRSLYGAFAANLVRFHAPDGRGYRLIADEVLRIDRFNNLTAASLAKAFQHYPRLDPQRKTAMREQLERMARTPGISTGVREVVENTLSTAPR